MKETWGKWRRTLDVEVRIGGKREKRVDKARRCVI